MENLKKSYLIIYGNYLSQPARSVLCFCKINKIPFTFHFINTGKDEHLSENYQFINLYGKIPAIVLKQDSGFEFKLGESCAILRFLSDYYKTEEKWYPRSNIFRKALIDQWLDWHHTNTRIAFSSYVFKNVFLKRLEQKGIKKEVFETEQMVGKTLNFLNQILANRKYIVDEEISIADLIISSEINQLALSKYDISNLNNLVVYLERVNSLENVKEVNQEFKNLMDKLKFSYDTAKF